MNHLQLVATDRILQDSAGLTGATQRGVRFLDFVVDGIPLYARLAKQYDFVSPFWLNPKSMRDSKRLLTVLRAETLLGKFTDDAVALYVCPECASDDFGCGAITTKIMVNGQTVEWHGFAFERDWEGKVEVLSRDRYIFDKRQYGAAFDAAVGTL